MKTRPPEGLRSSSDVPAVTMSRNTTSRGGGDLDRQLIAEVGHVEGQPLDRSAAGPAGLMRNMPEARSKSGSRSGRTVIEAFMPTMRRTVAGTSIAA